MSITTGTVNAPPSGTNPILVANGVSLNGNTGDVQFVAFMDPDSGSLRVASIGPNGLYVSSTISNPFGPGKNAAGTGQFVPVADTTVAINVGANATVSLVTGVAGKSIYVCAYMLMASLPASGSGAAQFVYGSGNTALSGAFAVTPETGVSIGSGYGAVLIVPAGQTLSLTTANGASVQGHLSYTQF